MKWQANWSCWPRANPGNVFQTQMAMIAVVCREQDGGSMDDKSKVYLLISLLVLCKQCQGHPWYNKGAVGCYGNATGIIDIINGLTNCYFTTGQTELEACSTGRVKANAHGLGVAPGRCVALHFVQVLTLAHGT